MFGHFELPTSKMNAMVEMPDVGTIQADHFAGCGKVFSGHFHKRQEHECNSTWAMLSPQLRQMPGMTTEDVWYLEWGKEPEFCLARCTITKFRSFASN